MSRDVWGNDNPLCIEDMCDRCSEIKALEREQRRNVALVAENADLRTEVQRLQKVEAAVTSVIDGALASILRHCGKTEEQILTGCLYSWLCSRCRPVWDMVCDLREAMEPEKEARHE